MAYLKDTSHVGKLGEALGCQYLKGKGYQILDCGYTNKRGYCLGEIDIVAQKGKKTVFVEVKTRRIAGDELVFPEQNITREKLRRLERIAQAYLQEKGLLGHPYAFDALAILYNEIQKTAKIRHLEDIFL